MGIWKEYSEEEKKAIRERKELERQFPLYSVYVSEDGWVNVSPMESEPPQHNYFPRCIDLLRKA